MLRKFCCCVRLFSASNLNYLIFGGLYFAVSKMFHHFFFEFVRSWSSLSGWCIIWFLSPGFKLNGIPESSHAFSALALSVHFISKFWRSSKFWYAVLLIFLQFLKTWVNLFISFNTLLFTSILFSSVCSGSVCLLTLKYFTMFS